MEDVMVFNDILDLMKLNVEKLSCLREYIECIEKLNKSCKAISNNLLYNNIVFYLSHENCQHSSSEVKAITNALRGELKKINLFDIVNTVQQIKELEELKVDANYLFNEILDKLRESCNRVYNFLCLSDNEQKESTLDILMYFDELLSKIELFLKINEELASLNKFIENSYEPNENEEIFSIRFHKENITTKEMIMYTETINSMYERICALFNISVQDYSLRPIKLESGSWMEKVLGNKKSMNFLFDLLDRGILFIYRNCTKEGKISTQENKINLLKEAINLTSLCEEHGINTEISKETLEANLNAMCKDIYKLTTSSNKITINQKVYDRNKEVSEKAIEEMKKLTIESGEEIALD